MSRFFTFAVLSLWCLGSVSRMGWAEPPAEEKLVSARAFGFFRCNVAVVWKQFNEQGYQRWFVDMEQNPLEELKENLGAGPEAIDRILGVLFTDEQGSPPKTAFMIAFLKPFDRDKIKKSLLRKPPVFAPVGQDPPPEPQMIEEKVGRYTMWRYDSPYANALCFFDDRHFLIGDMSGVKTLLESLDDPEPSPWRETLKRAQGQAAAVAVNLNAIPDHVKQEAPAPMKALVKARSLFISVSLDKEAVFLAEGVFADEMDAMNAATAVTGLLGLAKLSFPALRKEVQQQLVENPDFPADLYDILPRVEKYLNELKPVAEGNKAILSIKTDLSVGVLSGLSGVAITTLGASAYATFAQVGETIGEKKEEDPSLPRPQAGKAFKQLASALEKYREDHGHYPAPAILSPEGKPLLSWRVTLLPYLGHEDLYYEFKLNEPWNSRHNKQLIEKMPDMYRMGRFYSNQTTCRLITGEKAPFQEKAKTGPRLPDFKDGAAQTALIVEADFQVTWTRPESLKLISHFPLPRMGDDQVMRFGGAGSDSEKLEGFYAVMADGVVRFFDKKSDPKSRMALFTHTGGETLPEDKLGKVVK